MLINKIKVIFMRYFFSYNQLFSGFYQSWRRILISGNWKCFNKIIAKSAEDKIYFKAALEIFPSYLQWGNNKNTSSKIRVVADGCFR